jgi:hypothetical protein
VPAAPAAQRPEQVRLLLSARRADGSVEVTASQVSPMARVSTPTPPPSVSPATPTVAHDPPAIARPWSLRAAYTGARAAPAPTVAVLPLVVMPFIGRQSITNAGGAPPPDQPG